MQFHFESLTACMQRFRRVRAEMSKLTLVEPITAFIVLSHLSLELLGHFCFLSLEIRSLDLHHRWQVFMRFLILGFIYIFALCDFWSQPNLPLRKFLVMQLRVGQQKRRWEPVLCLEAELNGGFQPLVVEGSRWRNHLLFGWADCLLSLGGCFGLHQQIWACSGVITNSK